MRIGLVFPANAMTMNQISFIGSNRPPNEMQLFIKNFSDSLFPLTGRLRRPPRRLPIRRKSEIFDRLTNYGMDHEYAPLN
jgi:hypothetical protein